MDKLQLTGSWSVIHCIDLYKDIQPSSGQSLNATVGLILLKP